MKQRHLANCWQGVAIRLTAHFAIATSTLLFSIPTAAQIVPDATLPVNSIVTPNGNTFTINGGSRAGGNLFHSFQEFSLPTGSEAFFNNAVDVQNIFSRVTGSNISNIDGLIRANGRASLFLLNPNGIIFGRNARLNIGGSFIGSTATSIRFADGTPFSATNPTGTPLLTVSVPIGLQLGQNPAGITVQGTGHRTTGGAISPFDRSQNPVGLQVGLGNTLALVGGDINVKGGILTSTGGQIALGSIGQSNTTSTVGLQPASQGWNFNYDGMQQFGDITLSQAALLDASSGGGHIALQGRNISLQNGSLVLIQNIGVTPAGDIRVNASGLLSIAGISPDGKVRSSLENQTVGAGNGGNIQAIASDVTISDGAGILARSFGAGATGNIIVNASGEVQVVGFIPGSNANSIIGSLVFAGGNAGNIQVTANRLTLLAAGNITASTIGTGNGGNVEVDATSIEIAGFNPLTQSISNIGAATFGVGDSGSVRVNANRLILRDRGKITTGGFAQGNAGSVVVNAAESIDISEEFTTIDSSIEILPAATRAAFFLPDIPSGNAGSVTVNTPILRIENRGQVSVRNDGTGNAGSLQINANRVELNRQGAITASTRSGEGGNITLALGDVLIARNNSSINTESTGIGNGGNITIDSPTIVGLENSDIIANAVQGNGGNIQIRTQGIFGIEYRPQQTSESDITASSQFGLSGTVAITNPEVETRSLLVELPQNLVDPSQQITSGCDPTQGNTFTVAGRGGLPENPTSALLGRAIWWDNRDLSNSNLAAVVELEKTPKSESNPEIVEANGWIVNQKGQVELVAVQNNNNSWRSHPNCPKLP